MQDNTSKTKAFKSIPKKLIAVIIIIIIAAIAAFIVFYETPFEKARSEIVHVTGFLKGGDNYFTINTEDYGARQNDALKGIRLANEKLGFNDALYKKMLETTALMGRQIEENDHYRVSWSYHPDNGLKVTYEIK